jgi:hypothetical protein
MTNGWDKTGGDVREAAVERQLGRGQQRCNDLPAKTAILAEAEDYFRRVVETHR